MKNRLTRRDMLKVMGKGAAGIAAASSLNPFRFALAQDDFDYRRFEGEQIFVSWSKRPSADAIVPYIREFQELTGISVAYEVIPEQQHRQKSVIQMSAQSGEIDVWESPLNVEKRQFFRAGWYHPLNEFLDDPTLTFPDWDRDDFGQGAWAQATQPDGTICGLPLDLPAVQLAYRKDLFDERGLTLETLADIETAAAELHDPDNNLYGFVARGLRNANVVVYSTFLHNLGGSWLDADRNLNMTSPEAIEALELYARLQRTYAPPGVAGFNWSECQAMFLQGQAAIWIDGNNLLAVADDPTKSTVAGKVGYMTVPAGPGGRFAPATCVVESINPFSTKKEAGYLFNQWAVNKQNQVRALLAGSPVGRASAWTDPTFLEQTTLPQAWIDAVSEVSQIAAPMVPEIVPVTQFRDVFGGAFTAAIEGGDPAELLRAAQAEFEPIYLQSEA